MLCDTLIIMRKILLLTDGWRRFVSAAWSSGILQFMKEQGSGYTLSEFHCWGNWSHSESFNEGEYAIFSLPDFREYDGIIAELTNIRNRQVRDRLTTAIVQSGVPAISLCSRQEGFHCVQNDNYDAICTLFHHMWDEHGCRTFAFAGSRESESESADRERAFKDCCRQKGIAVTPDMITERDYTAKTGMMAAASFFAETAPGKPHRHTGEFAPEYDQMGGSDLSLPRRAAEQEAPAPEAEPGETGSDTVLTRSGHRADRPTRPIPDAFICANDNIAVGVAMEMKKHGYLCPDDYRITGFDNLDKALYYNPQITTVSLNRERVAYEAAKVLDRMMNGEDVPETTLLPADIIYSESCGCPNNGMIDYRGYLSWEVEDSINAMDSDEDLSLFSLSLNPSLTVEELMDRVLAKYAGLDLDGVYILLDKRLGKQVLASGYYDTGRLRVACACERKEEAPSGGTGMQSITFASVPKLRRHLDSIADGASLFEFPLHIDDRTAGVIIFRNPRFLVRSWKFFEMQDIVLRALEEWDVNHRLQDSLKHLRKIYDHDNLTGLYSKAVFSGRLLPWFAEQMKQRAHAAVIFLDVDHFKRINDTYGHDYGDQILQKTAAVLLKTMPRDSYSFRYGGDEFVSVVRTQEGESVQDLRQSLYDSFGRENIQVSIGVSRTTEQDFIADSEPEGRVQERTRESVDRCIREADQDMYREKKLHHAARR